MGNESHLDLKSLAEALIFSSSEPLTETQFIAAAGKAGEGQLAALVEELNLEYQQSGRAFEILNIAKGYQFFTRREYSGVLRKLFVERAKMRLSRAGLETLAVVAFRGPVTRSEIDEIRGVDSGGVLRTLLDRRLIAVKGRAKMLGRPLLYETSQEFLKHFGLSDLSELPRDSELTREWGELRERELAEQERAAIESPVDDRSLTISENGIENGHQVIAPADAIEPEKEFEP